MYNVYDDDNRDAEWEAIWDAYWAELDREAEEEERYQRELEQQRNVTVDEVLAALAAQTRDRRTP